MIKTLKGNKQQFKIPMPEGKKCIQKDNSSGVDCLLFTEKRMDAIENIWENGEKQEVERERTESLLSSKEQMVLSW